MGIDWGTPVLRQKKVERFDTPVVTMSALAGKGSGRKFMFNKAAQDALGLVKFDEEAGDVSYVSFGRNTVTNEIFVIASTTETEGMKMFKTNKSFAFSDKKTYEFLTRTLGLSNVAENHLKLEEVDGEAYYKVGEVVSDAAPTEGNDSSEEEPAQTSGEEPTMATTEVEANAEETAEAPVAEVAAETKEEDWED